jgi:nucleotide-binding universal stress UspA family protein
MAPSASSTAWPRRIVVAVDTSPESELALDRALQLAGRSDAGVVVVHAVGLLEEGSFRPAPDIDAVLAAARERVGAGCPASIVTEHGPAALVVIRVAEREQADLIVIGNRGIGGALGTLGSTSTDVVHQAHVPVLVVRSPPD